MLVSSVAKNEIGWFLSTAATAARMAACSDAGSPPTRADDRHPRPPQLPHRVIDLVRRRRVEAVGLDVANHADDLGAELGVAAAQQHLPERRLAREQPLRQRLVDDADARRAVAIAGGEGAARRRARFASAGSSPRSTIPRFASGRCGSGRIGRPLTLYGDRGLNPDSGSPIAAAASVTPALRAQLLDHLREELGLLRRRRISGCRHADERGRRALRFESGRRPLQLQEAHHQQAAADEQHDRQRDLGDDQRRAEAARPARLRSRARCPSALRPGAPATPGAPAPARRAARVTSVTPPVNSSARQFSVSTVFGGSCVATID